MKKLLFFVVVGFFAINSYAQTSVNQLEATENLLEVNRQWAKATPETFFNFLDTDILLLSPDKPVLRGHDGFKKLLGEFQSLPGFSIKWEPQEAYVSKSGDLGYTIDKILVSFDGEDGKKVNLFQKGITIWKKDKNDQWKCVVDMYNSDPTITSI